MDLITGVNLLALSDDTGLRNLESWCLLHHLKLIKAYNVENSEEWFSADGKDFRKPTSWGFIMQIKPTHQIVAWVERHPKRTSGETIFCVEARDTHRRKATSRELIAASGRKIVAKPAPKQTAKKKTARKHSKAAR